MILGTLASDRSIEVRPVQVWLYYTYTHNIPLPYDALIQASVMNKSICPIK